MTHDLYQNFLKSTGVSTDTRTIKAGNLFFALKGPNFNANKFAEIALKSGASFAVVDDPDYVIDHRTILVENCLKTLHDLATHHRRQTKYPVIGLTGSNGKTTTKELINNVLSKKYRTLSTRGNLNNHIGVPLTILTISESTEVGIIEMGANKVGDISELCTIAQPTHGLITNIGKAHIEGFGNLDGVIRGKNELYDWLLKNNGVVFINSEDQILYKLAARFKNPVSYPGGKDFYHCSLIETDPFLRIKTEDGHLINTRLIGNYNFLNVAAALCIAKYFEVPTDKAIEAIEEYEPRDNRSQIIKLGSNTIIMDAYNANPSSMEAALIHLNQLKSENKIAILGDMFELGDSTEVEHGKIGTLSKNLDLNQVIFCGERMRFAHAKNKKALYFRTRNELEEYLKNYTFEYSTILIKASRAMALENILNKL